MIMNMSMSMSKYDPKKFDYENVTKTIIIAWKKWAIETNTKKMCLGISGGKDSAVAAALACRVFGKDNVFGVLMPNGEQKDLNDSKAICNHLGIQNITINIKDSYDSIISQVKIDDEGSLLPLPAMINLPARLRMSTIFSVAQSIGAKVINTCNLSEDTIGWNTLFGDDCGAYGPLKALTCTEILELAKYLMLPEFIWRKAPCDGLCGSTDEESFGFSYLTLDTYIRTGYCSDWNTELKINQMYRRNYFKQEIVTLPFPKIPKPSEYYNNYVQVNNQTSDIKWTF